MYNHLVVNCKDTRSSKLYKELDCLSTKEEDLFYFCVVWKKQWPSKFLTREYPIIISIALGWKDHIPIVDTIRISNTSG